MTTIDVSKMIPMACKIHYIHDRSVYTSIGSKYCPYCRINELEETIKQLKKVKLEETIKQLKKVIY